MKKFNSDAKKNPLFLSECLFFRTFATYSTFMRRKKTFWFLCIILATTLLSGCHSCGSGSKENVQPDTVPVLIMQIQKCSRLYTTEFLVHKIVTYEDVVRLRGSLQGQEYSLRLPLGDRKVAIPMDATLKAYIDFSQFSESNISRSGDLITVTLPSPKVMLTSTKIDQKNVREYVSLLRAHFSDRELADFELQGREAILQSIPQLGIVNQARESAARLLIPLIRQMGFKEENITITFSDDFNPSDLKSLIENTPKES
jgi:hypothetical protein